MDELQTTDIEQPFIETFTERKPPHWVSYDNAMFNPENISTWTIGNKLYRRFAPVPSCHKVAMYTCNPNNLMDGFYFQKIITHHKPDLSKLSDKDVQALLDNQD